LFPFPPGWSLSRNRTFCVAKYDLTPPPPFSSRAFCPCKLLAQLPHLGIVIPFCRGADALSHFLSSADGQLPGLSCQNPDPYHAFFSLSSPLPRFLCVFSRSTGTLLRHVWYPANLRSPFSQNAFAARSGGLFFPFAVDLPCHTSEHSDFFPGSNQRVLPGVSALSRPPAPHYLSH